MDIETVRQLFGKYLDLLKSKKLQFDDMKSDKMAIDKILFHTEKLYFNYILTTDDEDRDRVIMVYKQLIRIIELHKNNKGWIY